MSKRPLIGEAQELYAAANLPEGVLRLWKPFQPHLRPVFRDIEQVFGVLTGSLKESELFFNLAQVLFRNMLFTSSAA